MSTTADQCPRIIVDGVIRKLGITIESPTTSMPMFEASGPMWTREQILERITDTSWTAAAALFADDWIKDQDGRGACAGYAAALALEEARHRRGLERVVLSGDAAYAACNGGRDAGSGLENQMVNIRDNGIPPANLVPRWEYRKNRIPAAAWREADRFKGFELYGIKSELALASCIAAGFTAVIAVHAGNGGRSPDGLIQWSNGKGNHSVACDDCRLRNGKLEFQIPNSWGLKWGERGRGWLRWDLHLSNPNRYHYFYALRSTEDDPQADNPPAPTGT